MANSIQISIEAFLSKKRMAWSESTMKSCKSFLSNYGLIVESGDPEALLKALGSKGKYTTQTYFIHAANFYEYLFPEKENVFKSYRKDHRNVFKNAYQTTHLEITYEEVKARLEAQPDSEEKEACLHLLGTAQRSSEAGLSRTKSDSKAGSNIPNEIIIGKGGKERLNLGGTKLNVSYYKVYAYIKNLCGISPHSLRKLALTRAAANGANGADLCEIAGWSSIVTAIRYLQPKRADELKKLLK